MKVNTFGRLALTAGIMAVAASGLVATPAYADPATLSDTSLVGFGSDTTQDVMQELSTAIGVDKLASFNSTWAAPAASTVTVRPGGPTNVPRAKGSGDGWKMLQVAEGSSDSSSSVGVIDTPATQTANKANTVGQIDYARASSKQGTQSNTGEYVNIPFATDVVGIAVDSDDAVSKIPLFIGSSTDAADVPSLNSIFRCNAKYVYTSGANGTGDYIGVGGTDTLPAGAGSASLIAPQIPVFGSGTAAFFIKAIFNATDTASWADTYSCIKRKKVDGTTNIQEHDGSPIDEVDNAIGIYSIGQWVAQTKSATTGVVNRTSGTTLLSLGALVSDARVAPTTGADATLKPNADNWPSALKRLVYNVVPYRKAVDPTSPIRTMFVGTGSLVCTNTASIEKMGFAVLTATQSPADDPTSNASSCGSINQANRAYAVNGGVAMTTAATVTNKVAVNGSNVVVNNPITVQVSGGVARHDMGGIVQILDAAHGSVGANVLGTATIAAGQDISADIAVTPTATGSTKLYAVFIPKLGGINVTPMSPVDGVTDASFATITVVNNSSTTKLSVRKPTSIGGNVRVVAWIDAGGATTGGTVTLYEGSVSGAVLATDTIAAGEKAAVLNYTQSVTSKTIVAVYDSTSNFEDSTSSSATVTLSKATPVITLTAPAATSTVAAPNGFVAGSGADWAIARKRVGVGARDVTINPTNDQISLTGHGLAVGAAVYFSGSGAFPAPVTSGTTKYFVKTVVSANAFTVSTTSGGTLVNFTVAGTSVQIMSDATVVAAGTFTVPAHRLVANDPVYFTGTTLPSGITAGTKYFVKAAPTANTFTVSNTAGGAAKTFTTLGSAVKVWTVNKAPKVTVTVAAPGVSLKPTGSIKVFIGTTSNDVVASREITSASTGLTIAANGTLTATLSKAELWTWINTSGPGTTTQIGTAYLIVQYAGDGAFNAATTVSQKIKVTP
jgi:hypothetical protein